MNKEIIKGLNKLADHFEKCADYWGDKSFDPIDRAMEESKAEMELSEFNK